MPELEKWRISTGKRDWLVVMFRIICVSTC
jgi:hypothetical protein